MNHPPRCVVSTATTSTASSEDDAQPDGNIYVRAWRFVQRRLHLRPRAGSCPVDMDSRAPPAAVEQPETGSYCSDWQRVHLLKELEEAGARALWRRQQQFRARHESIKEAAEWAPALQPAFRTQAQRKTAQTTCFNCGLLFFRPLAVAPDTSAFCSRDCQSTFEYRRDLQDAVNDSDTFQPTAGCTRSSDL